MKRNIIEEVLSSQGRTKTWIAEKIGVSRQSMYKYCSNQSQPSIFLFKDISEILEVKMEDLIK